MSTHAKTKHRSPRGSLTKAGSVLTTVWIPSDLHARLAAAVSSQDTDRSKFMRRAIRAELERGTAGQTSALN
jgi:predicted transcriptional regulator